MPRGGVSYQPEAAYPQRCRHVIDTCPTCEEEAMAQTSTCEHCGAVVETNRAQRIVVEDWTHYFCSERCKIQWGEQGEIEEEE
jgi:hypothetical protein